MQSSQKLEFQPSMHFIYQCKGSRPCTRLNENMSRTSLIIHTKNISAIHEKLCKTLPPIGKQISQAINYIVTLHTTFKIHLHGNKNIVLQQYKLEINVCLPHIHICAIQQLLSSHFIELSLSLGMHKLCQGRVVYPLYHMDIFISNISLLKDFIKRD